MQDETEIIAVSVDDREQLQMMVDRVEEDGGGELDVIMLSDPDHLVIDRYGLFNTDSPARRPVPHPATYVIDKEGMVRWGFVEVNYRVRPDNADILKVLRSL